MNAGIIGYGYWGKILTRNLVALLGVEHITIWDLNPLALEQAQQEYPMIKISHSLTALLNSSVDFVAIITPVNSHYILALQALKAGKHVFIEKPMTHTAEQARELIQVARSKNLLLMVDHTFLFTQEAQLIKDYLDSGYLGQLLYYYSHRANLGLIRPDVDVIQDLAPHDLSLLNYFYPGCPDEICSKKFDILKLKNSSVATMTLDYGDFVAVCNYSWVHPQKVRTITLVGSEKMLVWDHNDTTHPVKIFHSKVLTSSDSSIQDLNYSTGQVECPPIPLHEPLRDELEYFIDSIHQGRTLEINSGEAGIEVVCLLEQIQEMSDPDPIPELSLCNFRAPAR